MCLSQAAAAAGKPATKAPAAAKPAAAAPKRKPAAAKSTTAAAPKKGNAGGGRKKKVVSDSEEESSVSMSSSEEVSVCAVCEMLHVICCQQQSISLFLPQKWRAHLTTHTITHTTQLSEAEAGPSKDVYEMEAFSPAVAPKVRHADEQIDSSETDQKR